MAENPQIISGEDSDPLGRKAAESNVAEPQEIFRVLVDTVDEYAIFALDPQGYILTWNAGGQRLKGFKPDEVIGSHFSRFYTAPDIERDHPAFELREAADKGKYEEEGWRVRKDGTTFWANVIITALRSPDGTLRGFGKVTRDLTQKRIAEQRLRESEERFRLMVEGVEDYAIFMLDPDGRVATWNKGAERSKGYEAHEIIGQSFSKFYSEEDRLAGKPEWKLREARRAGRVADEGWRIRKDGSRFWASVVITPVWDAKGTLVGFSKVTRNLTERKAAEDTLRSAYGDLEARIQERTRELSEAKSRAEAAVRSRDQFFSMASHELRTPLSSLKLQAQIRRRSVKRGDLSDFAPERLLSLCDEDERQVDRLTALVDRMFDISKMTSGTFELQLGRFELKEMVIDVVKRLNPVLGQTQTPCSIQSADLPAGHWDRLRLEQVVTNLLSNAGKYAPGRPVLVSVGPGPLGAQIQVRDQGRGIPEADQARIFEPFERLKTRREISGLGLGLFICKRIVEAHGGRLSVASIPGNGTTFTIDLPFGAEPAGNS